MRLHVLSDVHLERAPLELPDVEADVLILAGDIARGTDGLGWARAQARGRPVLYVAGNHEFYGHVLPDLFDELRAAAPPVHVLEDDVVVIGGVRFLGCTLWSDFAFAGLEERAESMAVCGQVVNDYRVIRGASGTDPLCPDETLARHRVSRAWLEAELATGFDGPTVVITHHAPLIRGRPDSRIMRAVAGAFVSDLEPLMGADRAALWIYGHTHRAADLDVAGTLVISNPRGYPAEPVAEFDPARVVELD